MPLDKSCTIWYNAIMMVPKKIQAVQYYSTVEELYKHRFSYLVKVASRIVYDTSLAQDAVHSAFEKTLEYVKNHPLSKLRLPIIEIEVKRAARRLNKGYTHKELSMEHSNYEFPNTDEGSNQEGW